MFNKTKTFYNKCGVAITIGFMMASDSAFATGNSNSFSTISENITTSIADIPGLLTAVSYLFGILLGTLGIMKIKDHVENPTQTPLKDGAIRLLSGGALFSLPIVFEAMNHLLDQGGEAAATTSAVAQRVTFGVEQ